jgi:hypothetical protein
MRRSNEKLVTVGVDCRMRRRPFYMLSFPVDLVGHVRR